MKNNSALKPCFSIIRRLHSVTDDDDDDDVDDDGDVTKEGRRKRRGRTSPSKIMLSSESALQLLVE